MADWLDAWEKCFNLAKGEERIDGRPYEIVDYEDYLLNDRPVTGNVVLRLQQCYWLNRRYPDTFEAIAPALRDKFGAANRAPNKDRFVVAIHVRRGDVDQSRNISRASRPMSASCKRLHSSAVFWTSSTSKRPIMFTHRERRRTSPILRNLDVNSTSTRMRSRQCARSSTPTCS